MAALQASQFIGSKISLVTKAEIRYEGILYALDLQDATISLAKVKSFGTEDRPTDRPSPPKDEVFEFIIFRGADIKTLDVVEPPKSVTALTSGVPPNDPAIVEVSYYHGNGGGTSSSKSTQANNAGVLNNLLNGHSPTKSNGGGNRRRRKSANTNVNQNGGGQRRGRGNRNKNNSNNSGTSNNGNQSDGASSNNGATSGQRQTGRGRGRGRPTRQNSADSNTFFAQMQQAARAPHAYFQPPPPFMMRPPGPFRGGFRGGRGRSFGRRNQQPQGIIEAQQPAKVTFEEPFDFEKSHEELIQTLAKLEIVDKEKAVQAENGEAGAGGGDSDGEKENKDNAEVVYYCKDNFFDNISCEALKKQRPGRNVRIDRRAEQKLNTETFGASAARGGPRRGGGGGGSYYYRPNNYYRDYRSNHNPYLAMMAAGAYDPSAYFMPPNNGGYGNYRRGGGGQGGNGGYGGGGGGRGPSGGRGFYRGGFFDNF